VCKEITKYVCKYISKVKVKFSPCAQLIKHRAMKTYGVWRYSSTILDQLHTWAALTPGKEAAAPIGEEVG
jgi:hypothetical protein